MSIKESKLATIAIIAPLAAAAWIVDKDERTLFIGGIAALVLIGHIWDEKA